MNPQRPLLPAANAVDALTLARDMRANHQSAVVSLSRRGGRGAALAILDLMTAQYEELERVLSGEPVLSRRNRFTEPSA